MVYKIFGHQSPDTDTITSALVLEYIMKQTGVDCSAYRLGDVNKETQFALDTFGVSEPAYLESVNADDSVILVDHNEYAQSVKGIEVATLVGIYDHHKVDGFKTSHPLIVRIEPVGCTATILYKVAKEKDVEIPKSVAGLMLSAIISDTLLLKSPTCTEEDVVVAHALARVAGVDIQSYGLAMLQAGADLSDKTEKELLYIDSKPFQMGSLNVQVAQVNAIDMNAITSRKEAIVRALNDEVQSTGKDVFVLIVTDIINSNSLAYVSGGKQTLIADAFGVEIIEQEAFLPGVVSRKKQIVPMMITAAETNTYE